MPLKFHIIQFQTSAARNGCTKNMTPKVMPQTRNTSFVRADGSVEQVKLAIADMTPEERAIVKAGCLINYNRQKNA